MRDPVQVSVIIVNYNTRDWLRKCLNSLKEALLTIPTKEVIVADNGSSDQSVEMVESQFPWVKVIPFKENHGFAKANNIARKLAKGKYLFFLNPDTIVDPLAIERSIAYMELNHAVGLAGVCLKNLDNSVQHSVEYKYPGYRYVKKALATLPGKIAWVMGAGIIVRREVFDILNGFDEDFFLYGDDMDLCLRTRKIGYEIGFIKDAIVYHAQGESERFTDSKELVEKKLSAGLLFYRKHYPPQAVKKIITENLVHALWRIITITISMPIISNKKLAKAKLERYKTVFSFYKQIR